MRITSLGPYKTIDAFVAAKIDKFNSGEHSFQAMFELMFSERDNIIYEKSSGYKVTYTSYGDAYDRVAALAARLRNLLKDLPHDTAVGLYMANDIDWIITFWAILKSGYRPLLLNTRVSDDIIRRTMCCVGATAVISDGKIFPQQHTITYAELTAAEQAEASDAVFGSEVLVMSSGTTADPKICAYSAEEFYYQINDSFHIISQCKQIKKHYDGQLKLLTFLPFYHVFGLIAVYIWFAFFSRTFVHLSDFAPQTILNTIRRHKVTHIFAVPMFWNEVYRQAVKTIKARGEDTYQRFCKGLAIAERIQDVPVIGDLFIRKAFKEVRDNLFGESICFLITGGSEIRSEVLSFFNLIGYHLANGYGMTEIGITSVELSSKRSIRNEGYVGQPFSSVTYKLSEDGSLLVSGKSIARYIIERGEIIPRSEWFDTKDMAECVNGHFKIMGRKDDLIISENGENLNPCIIEPLLSDDTDYQLCLIGVEQDRMTTPVLLVYAGRHISIERYSIVRGKLVKKLQENQLSSFIRKIEFVNDPMMLPEDIKINRSRLRMQYAKGELSVYSPEQSSDTARQCNRYTDYVRELFAAAFDKPADAFGVETDFFMDEGGTSLDYFALITKIQEDHRISFPASQEKTLTTIYDLSTFIEDQLNHVD